jgi:hypothetical protein
LGVVQRDGAVAISTEGGGDGGDVGEQFGAILDEVVVYG